MSDNNVLNNNVSKERDIKIEERWETDGKNVFKVVKEANEEDLRNS